MLEVVLLGFEESGGIVVNGDRGDLVADTIVFAALLASVVLTGDVFYHIERGCDFAENGVTIVEERSGHGGDEKLRAIGAGACIGHRENPWFVVAELGVEFIGKLVAWTAATCFSWVAALEHEAINHAVESDVVVVATLGEVEEIGAGQWCLRGEKSGADVACGGVECDGNIGHDAHP